MRCDRCEKTFATYDGLYHHVGRKHGLAAQVAMMSPGGYAALPPVKIRISTPMDSDPSWIETRFKQTD